MLVEQLDVATSDLHEESREADRMRLFVATAKWETAMAELATTKALAQLTGKAFGMI